MRYTGLLFLSCVCFATVWGQAPASSPQASSEGEASKKSIEFSEDVLGTVLGESKKKSPTVHEDALRVWKNFNEKSGEPNYVYRFWARDLIESLKRKHVVFDDEAKVATVFKKLFDQGLISEHAVVTLTRDCWGYLVHREGIPGWEHKMPKELYPKSHIPHSKAPERSV